ncbi:hypothetical protein [Ruegeria halocynthiae]|uniref:hypothetical protein n=1 Tax=Ruegeria halocynthiae TaxID=985054 RepID=UPI0005638CD6|nr:hypothetical protein [Ruegeria halocynthiae]
MLIAEPDRDDAEKAENLRAFFSGEAPTNSRNDLSAGISDEAYALRQSNRLEGILSKLDDLDSLDEQTASEPLVSADEASTDRIDHKPHLTRYDKAMSAEREALALAARSEQGSDAYRQAMSDAAAARSKRKAEENRDADPVGRKQNETDRWRAEEGRPTYNASRRSRERPNDMTPNEVLAAMTPEQLERYKKDQKADSNVRIRFTKKLGPKGQGLTGAALVDAVEAEVVKRRNSRLAKRSGG